MLIPVLEAVEEGFAAEFDYRLEAVNLRRMVDEVPPPPRASTMRSCPALSTMRRYHASLPRAPATCHACYHVPCVPSTYRTAYLVFLTNRVT